jgi:5-methylcytosine-specific restriction protein A
MRAELLEWVTNYPIDRQGGLASGKIGAVSHVAVTQTLPATIALRVAEPNRYQIEGSTGAGNWADISWVAVLDQAVTNTTQHGYYVVYLLSQDGNDLYLTLNQGCQQLSKDIGKPSAKDELERRAAIMRARLRGRLTRLGAKPITLGTPPSHRLGPLYEAGHVVGAQYRTSALPSETELVTDLEEALAHYKFLVANGGYRSTEDIIEEADGDGFEGEDLPFKKKYIAHRTVERDASHAKKVKAYFNTDVCMGCDHSMTDLYGDIGPKVLEVHHLIPLETLATGQITSFRVPEDFALLCPSCHRVIHKIGASDLKALQKLARK